MRLCLRAETSHLVVLGSLGAGSLVWALCAVFVERDPTQVVAAVGSLAICGIAGAALFWIRQSRITSVAPRTADDCTSVTVDDIVHVHVAVGESPPKLAVFYAPQ
jgi:hypothetical protein